MGCPSDDVPIASSGGSATRGDTSTGGDTESGPSTATMMTGVGSGDVSSGSTSVDPDSTGSTTFDPDGTSSTGIDGQCGDGEVDAEEQCDGRDLGGEDCPSQGFDDGLLGCNPDCTFDTTGCITRTCGNDVIEGSEACDGADLAGEDCVSQGHDAGTLACLGNCSGFDLSGCVDFVCSNDVIEGTEVCDGADLAGHDCMSEGYDAGVLGCLDDCSGYDLSGCFDFMCGNDATEGIEVCDGADLGGEDCVSQGHDAGVLGCLGDCTGYDASGCVDYAGDCCADNGSPGCADPTCTNDVCAVDPFCCSNTWDAVCGGEAFTLCPAICDFCGDGAINSPVETCDGMDLGGASCTSQGFDGGTLGCLADCSDFDTTSCIAFVGDCCAANGTPGCDDPGCSAAVCAFDPLCCSLSWDAICGQEAAVEPACQGVGGTCPNCGNGVIEAPEACDGAALGGQTCVSQGFDGGTLGCQPDCSALDTSGCAFQGFGDCINNPPAAVCLPGEQCIVDPIGMSEGACIDVTCTDIGDCPLAPPGGTAVVVCTDITGEGLNECIIDCSGGQTCPTGMVCNALFQVCAWPMSP
ncbi:MAG: hypothetical protein KDK70_26255 [Myxococcales bacterium]|nr:hypothetical protein [Myxococcales bacterium]